MRVAAIVVAAWLLSPVAAFGRDAPAPLVSDTEVRGAFVLADPAGAAAVVSDPGDAAVVGIAARDLADDITTVTGTSAVRAGVQVWVGTLGHNRAIDALVAARRIDVRGLAGAWEQFRIATVDRPAPGVRRALVIVGSDRRGTAFGAYHLSRAIGVSPWTWWADVTPLRRTALYVKPGTHRFAGPSVKYRGIFLNDEDWGLHPWAATTFEPEARGIGPKTYERLFTLLLRSKANLLWPAMHKVSPALNANPANAALADRYGIVMGSSHAEPMLRNNVGEWTAPADAFDYAKNPAGVATYWRDRVATNGGYESAWTLGMRGIHDSGIVGATSMTDKRALMARIIADQRAMLKGVRGPQVFTPYKEVLDIWRAGLAVPDDVTLMWPDDNFGYIRRLPQPAERTRGGGHGIYYHLSYLGAPLSYLWLSTTPPALIGEEMGRAYDLGARAMWVANVGDLKPGELATDYFLSLGWDVGVRDRGVDAFVRDWAAENIAPDVAGEVTAILAEHHRLNFARRPEHLQWWLPGQKARASAMPLEEIGKRRAAFAALVARVRSIEPRVPAARTDAFFQLVAYPVEAAAMANERIFAGEAHDRLRDGNLPAALAEAARAQKADARIAALTARYNGGKWRGMMAVEPADGQWRSYRTVPPVVPAVAGPVADVPAPAPPASTDIVVEAEAMRGTWRRVDGIGRNGTVVASRIGKPVSGAVAMSLPPGAWRLFVEMLPTYPDADGAPLALELTLDGQPHALSAPRVTGDAAWAQGVLDNRITIEVPGVMAGGTHRIGLSARGGGVVIDRIVARRR
ncbi:glycosyl hydrolase 115 family protein [Sphingomonas sp. CFBP 13720]|uniref:glycosyl hydrolase 115 family protein n=1 Tax=Sphingomonas sp. CFBP 13720 TaxID=2775302 RepID=UPI0017841F4A|nr:glycosyl hydrolase 115 family protein [Sphingomonas sp. CFBP 13720]MBD8676994.1 glycosyl hydrolase 115 family protein [Sphingomonas sp. CFBP 13720]